MVITGEEVPELGLSSFLRMIQIEDVGRGVIGGGALQPQMADFS